MENTLPTQPTQSKNTEILVQAQQLAAVVCNAIGTLWAAEEQSAAKAKIHFHPDQSQFGAMAQKHGVTIYTITSPNPLLGMQYPAFMFFLLPTHAAKDILTIVGQIRSRFIAELKRAE